MKMIDIFFILATAILLLSCSKKNFSTNGETIYKTGRNFQGDKLLDKTASRIKIANSCKTCHGNNGDRMNDVSIKYSDLINPTLHNVPYTESLFFRFLDHDLKSDGTEANIGVIWKMSDTDKKDLLDYLKTL